MSARIELFPQIAAAEHYVDDTDGDLRRVEAGEPTGDWYWRLIGGNGETVCVSEAYTRKASARRGAVRFAEIMNEFWEWKPNAEDSTDWLRRIIKVVSR